MFLNFHVNTHHAPVDIPNKVSLSVWNFIRRKVSRALWKLFSFSAAITTQLTSVSYCLEHLKKSSLRYATRNVSIQQNCSCRLFLLFRSQHYLFIQQKHSNTIYHELTQIRKLKFLVWQQNNNEAFICWKNITLYSRLKVLMEKNNLKMMRGKKHCRDEQVFCRFRNFRKMKIINFFSLFVSKLSHYKMFISIKSQKLGCSCSGMKFCNNIFLLLL